MQTWLDWYAHHSAAIFMVAETICGEADGLDVFQSFARVTAEASHLVFNKVSWYEESRSYDFGWFLANIHPFAGHICEKPPFAAKLNADAIHDLRGAPISDDVRDLGRRVRSQYQIVYLDMEDRAYPLTGGLQLRSLFIWPSEIGEHFCAVITLPGSNLGRRIAWSEGRYARHPEDSAYDDVWAMASRDIRHPRVDAAWNFDYAQLAEIEDFAWLTLAYLETEQENGAAPMERLPHLPAADPRWSGRKARQVAKKFSLFTVVCVSTRNLDRGPLEASSQDGHTKRRHHVRGHFRLQACGERWSKRRLRWIPAHERGSGDLPLPIPLHVVRAAHPHREAA